MPKVFVEESIQIAATPEQVFEFASDFNTWSEWSPWLCSEPDAKVTVSSDGKSVGSVNAWNGDVVGQGEMEHKKLDPGKRIESDLRFIKPWKSQADVFFNFQPTAGGTKVSWAMDTQLPWFMFWMKGMMENFIGMDYARGLKMMKEKIETGSVLSKCEVKGREQVGPIHMLGVRKTSKMADIGEAMDAAITKTIEKLGASGTPADGTKMAAYHKFDPKARTLEFTAGVMTPEPTEVNGLESWSAPQTDAFAVRHVGSYCNLGNGWSTANSYVRHKKLKQAKKMATFEIYRNDPSDTAPGELVTDIYLPLR